MTALRILLTFLLISAFAQVGLAQDQIVQRQYKGKPQSDINVGIFTTLTKNCTAAPLPAIRIISPPGHGKITVKQGRLRATNIKQCLAVDVPAFVAVYRSEKEFLGRDTFTLEVVGVNGKAEQQIITVTVMEPGPGKGI
jgi:hypothetical protein